MKRIAGRVSRSARTKYTDVNAEFKESLARALFKRYNSWREIFFLSFFFFKLCNCRRGKSVSRGRRNVPTWVSYVTSITHTHTHKYPSIFVCIYIYMLKYYPSGWICPPTTHVAASDVRNRVFTHDRADVACDVASAEKQSRMARCLCLDRADSPLYVSLRNIWHRATRTHANVRALGGERLALKPTRCIKAIRMNSYISSLTNSSCRGCKSLPLFTTIVINIAEQRDANNWEDRDDI